MSTKRRIAGIALFLFVLVTPLPAQSTPEGVRARLKDRPLYIRNSWSDDTLYFDGNGDLAQPSKRSSFTLTGFALRSVKLKDGVLMVSGGVVGLEFPKDKPERVDLRGLGRMIRITPPVNGDYGPALDAIFADGIEALAPELPEYWQQWARKTYPGAYPTASGSSTGPADSPAVRQVGGGVSAPQLLQHTEASFTEAAKAFLYSGRTLVSLIVETDGRPAKLAISTPCGLDLDEKALLAVQSFRFKPAMEMVIRCVSWLISKFFSRLTSVVSLKFVSGRNLTLYCQLKQTAGPSTALRSG